jgi:peroxin-6
MASDGDTTAGVAQGNQRAFTQLLGLAQASLMPQALTFDLPITMLLKGSRGIGKFTTAVQVARRLGMHIFEVDFRGVRACTQNVLMPLTGELL